MQICQAKHLLMFPLSTIQGACIYIFLRVRTSCIKFD